MLAILCSSRTLQFFLNNSLSKKPVSLDERGIYGKWHCHVEQCSSLRQLAHGQDLRQVPRPLPHHRQNDLDSRNAPQKRFAFRRVGRAATATPPARARGATLNHLGKSALPSHRSTSPTSPTFSPSCKPPCALVAPKLCEGASSRRLPAHALNHPIFGFSLTFRPAEPTCPP